MGGGKIIISYCIIVEIDKHIHKYEDICECVRINEIVSILINNINLLLDQKYVGYLVYHSFVHFLVALFLNYHFK